MLSNRRLRCIEEDPEAQGPTLRICARLCESAPEVEDDKVADRRRLLSVVEAYGLARAKLEESVKRRLEPQAKAS